MEHPFLPSVSLSDKTPEEIQKVIGDLMNKLTFASRTGNRALMNQLQMVLESYRTAYNTKMEALMKKQNVSDKINISN